MEHQTISLCLSRQRAAVGAGGREAGRLRGGGPANGHADQEEHLRGHAFLDGAGGHQTVGLRLQGELRCIGVFQDLCGSVVSR